MLFTNGGDFARVAALAVAMIQSPCSQPRCSPPPPPLARPARFASQVAGAPRCCAGSDHYAWDIVEGLTTEVGPRLGGHRGRGAGARLGGHAS